MKDNIYKAGKLHFISVIVGSAIMIVCTIAVVLYRGFEPALISFLLLPLFWLYRLLTSKPVAVISETQIQVFNPDRTVPIEKVERIISQGKDRIELILTDELPLPIFIKELSKSDRENLKITIQRIIKDKRRA